MANPAAQNEDAPGDDRAGGGADDFSVPFTMAFQPIVDALSGGIFGYEALVRGRNNEPAFSVLAHVTEQNRYGFDQACRIKAIELGAALGLPARGAALSINFLPNAVYDARASLDATLWAAERVKFPPSSVIFEITEAEEVKDHAHLTNIVEYYRSIGFRTAIDDFGAGYSGLALLARFQPDIIKLDMELVRGIDAHPVRRTIMASILRICEDLGITAIAEGVETEGEYLALRDAGVCLFQGYLFARPAFEALPVPAAMPGPAPILDDAREARMRPAAAR